MSLRPIEMQTSYTNSQTVGKIQEQMQQRSQNMQELIMTDQKEQTEQRLKKPNEAEKTAHNLLEPDKEEKKQRNRREEKEKKERKKQRKIPHPYKGKFIDFTG